MVASGEGRSPIKKPNTMGLQLRNALAARHTRAERDGIDWLLAGIDVTLARSE
jgi:hypothetical protein